MKRDREYIYGLENITDEQGLRVADLEVEFSDMNGYTAETDAEELLLGLGIPLEDHGKLMKEIAPGIKLRVLLAQALLEILAYFYWMSLQIILIFLLFGG